MENEKLMIVAQESKIDLTKAEAYAVNYMPFMNQVNELSQPLKELDKENPTSAHAKIARENRLKLVKVRTAAEAKKVADKEMIVIEGKLIDGLFNVVKNAAQLTEGEYAEIEKFQERKEAERKEALKQSRIDKLAPYDCNTEFINLSDMSDDVFERFFETAKIAFDSKQETLRLAEAARIEAERLEAERIEAQRIENERLKREAKEAEALLAKERVEAEKARAKREALAASRTKELMPYVIMIRDFNKMVSLDEAEYQKELAEIKIGYQQHLVYQAEEDRKKEEAHRVEKERAILIEAERLAKFKEKQANEAKEAREKAAELAPDKEKINAMFIALRDFKIPEFKTEEAKKIGAEVKAGIDIILTGIKDLSKSLK